MLKATNINAPEACSNEERTQSELEDFLYFYKYMYYEKDGERDTWDLMISDREYDLLENELRERFPDSEVLTCVGSPPREMWPKYETRRLNWKRLKDLSKRLDIIEKNNL